MPSSPKWRDLFHDLLTGEEKDLYDANTDDATLAIYAVDGTVRVFDLQTGVLLTDTTIDPVDHQVRAHIYPEGNGWAWVEQDDNDNYDAAAIHICGPDGIHKTLDPAKLDKTYNYYSPLLSTEDGIYFYGWENGQTRQAGEHGVQAAGQRRQCGGKRSAHLCRVLRQQRQWPARGRVRRRQGL